MAGKSFLKLYTVCKTALQMTSENLQTCISLWLKLSVPESDISLVFESVMRKKNWHH